MLFSEVKHLKINKFNIHNDDIDKIILFLFGILSVSLYILVVKIYFIKFILFYFYLSYLSLFIILHVLFFIIVTLSFPPRSGRAWPCSNAAARRFATRCKTRDRKSRSPNAPIASAFGLFAFARVHLVCCVFRAFFCILSMY